MTRLRRDKKMIAVLSTMAILVGIVVGSVFNANITTGGGAVSSNSTIVIIDAGHGGIDGGATSESGISEKGINLAIAKMLEDYCKLQGIEVIMTRETDQDVSGLIDASISEKKKIDMQNRLQIMYDNPNSIFVSIHQNKFPESQYWGTQVFFSTNDMESSKLAQTIQSNIRENLQPDNNRETKPGNDQVYLLNNAKSTAVVVECGFLSNEAELSKLTDQNYQQQLAYNIYISLLEHL